MNRPPEACTCDGCKDLLRLGDYLMDWFKRVDRWEEGTWPDGENTVEAAIGLIDHLSAGDPVISKARKEHEPA